MNLLKKLVTPLISYLDIMQCAFSFLPGSILFFSEPSYSYLFVISFSLLFSSLLSSFLPSSSLLSFDQVLDRMVHAKRLASTSMYGLPFGKGYGNFEGFEDDDWLDYSFYSTDSYTCYGHGADDAALVMKKKKKKKKPLLLFLLFLFS